MMHWREKYLNALKTYSTVQKQILMVFFSLSSIKHFTKFTWKMERKIDAFYNYL